jgi:hypothetical protein
VGKPCLLAIFATVLNYFIIMFQFRMDNNMWNSSLFQTQTSRSVCPGEVSLDHKNAVFGETTALHFQIADEKSGVDCVRNDEK